MQGHQDPYPFYRALRAGGPILRTPVGTLVFGYDDCQQVLHSHDAVHNVDASLTARGFPQWQHHPALRLTYMSMLVRNPPDHTRLRRLVSKAFTRHGVEQLKPAIARLADTIVQQMLDQVRSQPSEPVDLISACAYQLPVAVIGELLGVPAADRPQFQQLVLTESAVLELLIDEDSVARADAAANSVNSYFDELIRQRRAHPRDDLTSRLVAVEEEGDRLTHEELLQTLALLMGAGFETTSNLIANAVAALMAHPDQLNRWRADNSLTTGAIDELLRFDSPSQLLARAVTHDMTLPCGEHLADGEVALLIVGAANRDPARYTDPDNLILNRPDPRPLSFGAGIHHCLGAALARAEADIMLARLMHTFPTWTPAPGARRREGLTIRGYTQLPVLLTTN